MSSDRLKSDERITSLVGLGGTEYFAGGMKSSMRFRVSEEFVSGGDFERANGLWW